MIIGAVPAGLPELHWTRVPPEYIGPLQKFTFLAIYRGLAIDKGSG